MCDQSLNLGSASSAVLYRFFGRDQSSGVIDRKPPGTVATADVFAVIESL